MTTEELRRRQERAETEPLIIAQTEGGFRVHSPMSARGRYFVSGIPDAPECTCPDFQQNRDDPEWRCKHILAVMNRQGGDAHSPHEEELAAPDPPHALERPSRVDGPRMLLKRSVSPDGRIDSLSVELSAPTGGRTPEDIADGATVSLRAQDLIVGRFLSGRGNGPREARGIQTREENGQSGQDGAIPAELVGIRGMDGKWGRRLYMTVRANGGYLRLYGSTAKLAEHLREAGYPEWAGNAREGVGLNLPCRIVTRTSEDGYVSVERVLPELGPAERSR